MQDLLRKHGLTDWIVQRVALDSEAAAIDVVYGSVQMDYLSGVRAGRKRKQSSKSAEELTPCSFLIVPISSVPFVSIHRYCRS